DPLRFGFGLGQRRQQERREDGDDGDDHQQFDQSEGPQSLLLSFHNGREWHITLSILLHFTCAWLKSASVTLLSGQTRIKSAPACPKPGRPLNQRRRVILRTGDAVELLR